MQSHHWSSAQRRFEISAPLLSPPTSLAKRLEVERNMFMDLVTTYWAIDAMKAYVRNLEEQR